MFSFCNDKHRAYQKEYTSYASNSQQSENQPFKAQNCEYNSNICNLWLFKGNNPNGEETEPIRRHCEERSDVAILRGLRQHYSTPTEIATPPSVARNDDSIFLVIPSLFNSPEILLFNDEQSYIEYLRYFGDVYLLEWKENKDDTGLARYVDEVVGVLTSLRAVIPNPIHLIGHCIGGNIAIFANLRYKEIASLTLLTTPWDYSHFSRALLFSECLDIRKSISGLQMVPRLYIQMMFFMLFPGHYEAKIAKYFAIDSKEAREKYLRIEQWLQSGIDIPAKAYNEILDDIIIQNSLMKNNYRINSDLIKLDQISVPTCIISAENDQIAPLSSMLPLQKEIKNSKLVFVEGGHIGYLINDDQKFKEEWGEWFLSLARK